MRGIVDRSEHLSDDDINRYLNKRMSAADALAADDHLSACANCRERFLDPATVEATYGFVRCAIDSVAEPAAEYHTLYEDMAAYVDGDLGSREREHLLSHLENCVECDAAVAELQGMREAIASDLGGGVAVEPGITVRAVAALGKPSPRIVVPIMIVLLLVAGLGWIGTRRFRSALNEMRAEVDRLQGENDRLQEVVKESRTEVTVLGLRLDGAVVLRDEGGVITLDRNGELGGLDILAAEYRQEIRSVLESGRVFLPAILGQLHTKPKNMMGPTAEQSFKLIAPVGVVVESDRPTFRWSEFSGVDHYEVVVYEVKTLKEIAVAIDLHQTEWRPSTALTPNVLYAWQVRAVKDRNEIKIPSLDEGEARFAVLDRKKAAEIEDVRRDYKGFHLLLGTLYARAGLVEKAEQEFEALRKTNPQSGFVRELLKSLSPEPGYRKRSN